jgi:paraquat-inducible protein B
MLIYIYVSVSLCFCVCFYQTADPRAALDALSKAVVYRLDGVKMELSLMTSIKDLLEGELSTSTLQKDMLQRDLGTVTEQHEALKAAYDALSYETAHQQSKASSSSSSEAVVAELREQLERANGTKTQLEADLLNAQRHMHELEKWPAIVNTVEMKLNTALQEASKANVAAQAAKEEAGHYKKLTETLKQKLRDLGANGGGDNKEFLDSFEEVMKEEMMTMKNAFETKLRIAREEADNISKKHQQEIVRMQNTSPYNTALNRHAVAAAGGGGVSSAVPALGGLGGIGMLSTSSGGGGGKQGSAGGTSWSSPAPSSSTPSYLSSSSSARK